MAYSEKELEKWLTKFIHNHPHELITVKKLFDYSHISRATWYRHPNIIKKIEKINRTPVTVAIKKNETPSAKAIISSCKNENELIQIVQTLLDEINSLKITLSKSNIQKLQEQNYEMKRLVNEQKNMIKQLTSQINGDIATKLIPEMSSQEIIESTNIVSFKEQFSSLFEGVD